MDRRKFISKTIKGFILPTILPTGRLFAKTSEQKVGHVVFCLFAGGIRNFESLQKSEGNLMRFMLQGNESVTSDISAGIDLLPFPDNIIPLEKQGTLYREFRYNSDETIHYSAHAAAITGNYKGFFQIMKPLSIPTVFELFRKHGSASSSALNCWWVSDQAGPFPYLNYSNHSQYGALYGANMLHPDALYNVHLNELNFFSNETQSQIKLLKDYLLSKNIVNQQFNYKSGIINSDEDRFKIELFLKDVGSRIFGNPNFNFWNLGESANEDIVNMYTACEILKAFQPELLVVNMQHTDIGHSNFTQMCNNLQKADFALAQLWNTIQKIPQMKDNTVLIAAPEFGRNSTNNTLVDQYGRYAVDHTGDENSKKIFCLLLGPNDIIKKNNSITDIVGETVDILPTIADLLGFRTKIPRQFLNGRVLNEAYV